MMRRRDTACFFEEQAVYEVEREDNGRSSMTYEELIRMLKEEREPKAVNARREEIAEILPAVRIMFDFDQRNHAHQYDLWMHCVHTALGLPRGLKDDMLYLAALVHDIGKPECQVKGKREDDPNMHYYGHPEVSARIVREKVIPELERKVRLTEDDRRRLLYYVAYHDDRMSLRIRHLRQHLEIPVSLGEFQNLMLLEVADAKAHVQIPIVAQRAEICGMLAGEYGRELYREILREKEARGAGDKQLRKEGG